MSTRANGVNEYGLIFGEKEKNYARAAMVANGDCEADVPIEDCEIEEAFYLSSYGDFTGEAIGMLDNGYDDYQNFKVCDNYIMFVPLNHPASLLKPAYNSVDEIVEELKKKLGSIFPDDYDYRNNVVHIMGSYYG